MRREIKENGESVISYEDFNVLCVDASLPRNHWDAVAKIAIDESWSFTFYPDRSVRFAPL